MTQPVHPPEGGVVGHGHIGQLHTQVSAVDQVTVAGDGAGHLFSEIGGSVDTVRTSLQKI